MKARGRPIAIAMREMFVRVVRVRKAFSEMPRARATTMKNQRRMMSFHLYFIRMKMMANARAKANMRLMKFGCSSSGVWRPNGREPSVRMISDSPVAGFMIVWDVGL